MTRILLVCCLLWILPCTLHAADPDVEWTYKTVDGTSLKLSVFVPEDYQSTDSTKTYPAFVIFHGGSWQSGEASWHFPDCEYWSSRGMIAVSVDYRLKDRDNVEVPLACVQDAKSAIRFLRKNAEALKVNPNAIVVAGGSAGGQLAAATATIKSDRSDDPNDDASISCVPNAVVLFNPWFKCEAELSPPSHITKGLPPFITFQGGQDPGIPVDEIKAFHQSLQEMGNRSALLIGNDGKHGFCNGRNPNNPFFYWALDHTDRFLVELKILSGRSLIDRPQGVLPLPADDYQTPSNSMELVSAPAKPSAKPVQQTAAASETSSALPVEPAVATLMDTNKDGKITREEFLSIRVNEFAHWDRNADSNLSPGEHPAEHVYKIGDADKNGSLSKKEYFAIFEKHFAFLDSDKDGELTTADKTPDASNATDQTKGKLPIDAETAAKIDTDKNGRISKAEFLSQSVSQFGGKDTNKDNFLSDDEFAQEGLFLTSDKDLDGKLSQQEFLKVCEVVFSNLDKDKNGALTPADISNVTMPTEEKFPLPEHLKELLDVNKDNQVTRDEFLDFRRKQFGQFDKDGDQSLTTSEYTHEPSFKFADKDENEKLTLGEFMSIFESHFTGLDRNKDGLLTSADVKQE